MQHRPVGAIPLKGNQGVLGSCSSWSIRREELRPWARFRDVDMTGADPPTSGLATDRAAWQQLVMLLREQKRHPFTNRYMGRNVSQSLNKRWLLRLPTTTGSSAAAAQIRRAFRAGRANGRAAMIGFVVGVLTEALTGHGIVSQITFGLFGCTWLIRPMGRKVPLKPRFPRPHWPSLL